MTTEQILDAAMQAMPISDMSAVTQGHVYGVLSLALMMQEAEYTEQLRLADEELQDARRKWAEQNNASNGELHGMAKAHLVPPGTDEL